MGGKLSDVFQVMLAGQNWKQRAPWEPPTLSHTMMSDEESAQDLASSLLECYQESLSKEASFMLRV